MGSDVGSLDGSGSAKRPGIGGTGGVERIDSTTLRDEPHAATIDRTRSPLRGTGEGHRYRADRALRALEIEIEGTRGFAKAEVTAGGADLREVDPRTMHSRCTSGLYIAGEILDVDGPIGGYNFQAAFSTGWLAGDKV